MSNRRAQNSSNSHHRIETRNTQAAARAKAQAELNALDPFDPRRRIGVEVFEWAKGFDFNYPRYLQLHYELEAMHPERDRRKEGELLFIRTGLVVLKNLIYAGLAVVEDRELEGKGMLQRFMEGGGSSTP